MRLESLSFDPDCVLRNSVEISERLQKIVLVVNAQNWETRVKYVRSLLDCAERLKGLGHNSGCEISIGNDLDNEGLSFYWSACGMVGGMVFHEGDGWTLHS